MHKQGRAGNIQKTLFRSQFLLIISLALMLGLSGILININFETKKRDQNLKNVAETIARSPFLTGKAGETESLIAYFDSLKEALGDIDVISVVSRDGTRIYHSNHALIGTTYDGTVPQFETDLQEYFATDEVGPSGRQRRAYAAVYDENGSYVGFVMAIMLMENIRGEFMQTLMMFGVITIAAVIIEVLISMRLSARIKGSLMGHEPDAFSAMYQIRENILDTLGEGIIAVDNEGTVQFVNQSAAVMLEDMEAGTGSGIVGKKLDGFRSGEALMRALTGEEKEMHIQEHALGNTDMLIDRIPVRDAGERIGTVGILHNRREYTRLMEDLAGTRYLVDSMRANNHDFTNKLHVILGLIQMEMYDEAVSYIENITIVQRETISSIMRAVDVPALAALLIGKTARASELNVRFRLREGSGYSSADLPLPAEALVTIAGNLIDNAFDSMNGKTDDYNEQMELIFGIYSKPGQVLITVMDTGVGIAAENMERIFENGYSTKGEGRGTGLHMVKNIVEGLGGTICVESQAGIGTSFTVSIQRAEGRGEAVCTEY